MQGNRWIRYEACSYSYGIKKTTHMEICVACDDPYHSCGIVTGMQILQADDMNYVEYDVSCIPNWKTEGGMELL